MPASGQAPWRAAGVSGGGGTETPAISPHDPEVMLLNCDMSGAYRTTDGGRSWTLFHWRQLMGCPFCAPVFHPSDAKLVFAAHSYAATLRRSMDGGATWEPYGEGLPGDLRVLAIDRHQPAVMLAAHLRGLHFSTDGGETWQAASGFSGTPRALLCQRRLTDGQPLYLAASDSGVFRAVGTPAVWELCSGLPAGRSILAFAGGYDAPRQLSWLYAWISVPVAQGEAKSGDQLWRSGDQGESWERLADLPVRAGWQGAYHALLCTDVQPERLYAVKPIFSADDTVYRSDDAGQDWRSIAYADKTEARCNLPHNYVSAWFYPRSLWSWSVVAAAINPVDPDQIFYNHYCSIFLSRDGGATWQAGEITRAADDPPGPPDSTSRWVANGLQNTTTWQYLVDPFEPQRHTIAYTDLGLFRSLDAGQTWIWMRGQGPNCYQLTADPAQPGRLWAAFSIVHDIPNNNIVLGHHRAHGQGSLGYSDDFGATWVGRNQGLPGADTEPPYDGGSMTACAAPVTSVVLDPRSPVASRTLFAALWEHGVYRSVDGGLSWESRSIGLGVPGVNLRACRLELHPDGTLFCLITGKMRDSALMAEGVGLYRSADQGGSWSKLTGALDLRWLTDFTVDPRYSRIVYFGACDDTRGLAEGGLFGTRDGGQSWTRLLRRSSRHFGVTLHPGQPDWLYATLNYNDGVSPALWLSRDAGLTWAADEDYPFCSAHRVHFNPHDAGEIFVSTYGASILHRRL